MNKILVADDELSIRRMLRVSLESSGYEIYEAVSGEDALKAITINPPDLILLDIMLPDIDGIETLKKLREWSSIPVIMLTAIGSDPEKIESLDAGADDYLTKPFSMAELLARIRVCLRRNAPASGKSTFVSGDLFINFAARSVHFMGSVVHLTATEYDLLILLIKHQGRLLTHSQILKSLGIEGDVRSLRVHITQLRRKIEKDPSHPTYIFTESGIGYRFREPDRVER
jgi:two-component system, OmpR family, KDP operon response regulator KdpE